MVATRTITVRLAPPVDRRLEKAAALMKQPLAAFLGKAGDEAARRVLLDWAVNAYRRGSMSLSQLAEETGLSVEEVMVAQGSADREAAVGAFLASAKTVAETQGTPQFLELAREAVVAAVSTEDEPGAQPSLKPPTPSAIGSRWRADDNRLLLTTWDEGWRREVDVALDVFSKERKGNTSGPGGPAKAQRGGPFGLTQALREELDAGFLSWLLVKQLSHWCHSEGPGYRGAPRTAARNLSLALFGRVVPPLSAETTPAWEWLSVSERAAVPGSTG
jgi:hypothetical protein